MRDYAYEAALRFANRIRKEDGKHPLKRLPKGRLRKFAACPLAKAAGPRCGVSTRRLYGGGPSILLPRDVSRFVRKFDNGKYPELIA